VVEKRVGSDRNSARRLVSRIWGFLRSGKSETCGHPVGEYGEDDDIGSTRGTVAGGHRGCPLWEIEEDFGAKNVGVYVHFVDNVSREAKREGRGKAYRFRCGGIGDF